MMRNCGRVLLLAFTLVASACNNTDQEQEVIVVEEPPVPVVDSVQLQVEAYEQQLTEAEEDIGRTLRQLNRLSAQLEDSINGTRVPPQIQEETINNYRNKLHEVKQVQVSLLRWQERETPPADSLSSLQRKEYLEAQLEKLEQLMQETRNVRMEANQAMQESDRDEY